MSETLRFQLARGVQRRRPSAVGSLPLFDEPVTSDQLFAREGFDFPDTGDYPGEAVIVAANGWRDDPTAFADPYRAGTPTQPGEPSTPREYAAVIDMLRRLDDWLTGTANGPAIDELAVEIAASALAVPGIDDADNPDDVVRALLGDWRWGAAWDCLRRSFCSVLAAYFEDGEAAARAAGALQRLLLIAGLTQAVLDEAIRPTSAQEVRRLLRDRVVIVPSPPFPIVDVEPLAPRRRARLAERAGFGDLWVLREEWSCYQPGEIAHIENVLEGERHKRVHRRIDETETTETTETETTRTDQLDTQTTDRFEVTDEASRDTSLAIRVDGQIDTSGQYGPTKVDTHIGGSLEWSVDESRRHASQVAHESVERAVHRVEERVRVERVRRTLTRVEEKNLHEIDNRNAPDGNVVGIYRWVDKVQRMQLFRYPNRYLLEFQLPEPAAYLRWLESQDVGPQPTTPPPPPFTTDGQPPATDGSNLFTPTSFVRQTYSRYAARWRATVEPPPETTIWVSGSATLSVEQPDDSDQLPLIGMAPTATETVTLAIPDGYSAVAARATAAAAPFHGRWLDHPAPWGPPFFGAPSDGWDPRDGYHVVCAEVTLGSNTIRLHQNNTPTVRPASDAPIPQYTGAWLSAASSEVVLSGAPERELAAGITVAGTYDGTVSVALRCAPTASTVEQWRLDTYQAMLDAYRGWQAQFDNERRAMEARSGVVIAGSSPARNREVIREELKRLTIEMLYGYRFAGESAVDRSSSPTVPPFVNHDRALDVGPYIQFLEQVFEWDKLTYVLYPYYWSPSDQWPALQPIEGADAEYARFLRSGSARVVLAARPGYEGAVNHWLWFGRPWGGGPAPTPEQDGYVSIADEIRALNEAPDDGEPQESWEVRLPTTLVWLDPDPSLPTYNRAMRLDRPRDPGARLCHPPTGDPPEDDAPDG